MSLFITSLNSGSNGNCYYVGNANEAIIVDVGISCREVCKRMERLNLELEKVKGIFISHEHSDHIRGVEVLSKKFNIPVYITQGTLNGSKLRLASELTFDFKPYQRIVIGELEVLPFPKSHDAADPHSFMVTGNGVNVGVLTDIGYSCEHVSAIFKQCHAVFLEANYDDEMLQQSLYPYYLKQRISSEKGHLSNEQALNLFKMHRHDQLQYLILSHLSRENNSPQLVKQIFVEHARGENVMVASRDYETELFQVFQPTNTKLL